MLIHRGTNKLDFPYNLKVVSHDEEVLVPTLLWTTKNYVYDSPVYWSVETKFKDQYDSEVLEINAQDITFTPIGIPSLPRNDPRLFINITINDKTYKKGDYSTNCIE